MKYYTEYKIKSFEQLSLLVLARHKQGGKFGFYFDLVNKVRFFSDEKTTNSKLIPNVSKFVSCTRVRAAERQTPRQQEKRMQRLKEHLAKKGIEYKEDKKLVKINSDYFIHLNSLSSKRNFVVSVKNMISSTEKTGEFDSYGFSKNGATVPLF